MPLSAQYVLVVLAVLFSAGYVLRSQCPTLLRAVRLRVAAWMLKPQRAPWMHQAGRTIAPPARTARGCGDTGCSGCD